MPGRREASQSTDGLIIEKNAFRMAAFNRETSNCQTITGKCTPLGYCQTITFKVFAPSIWTPHRGKNGQFLLAIPAASRILELAKSFGISTYFRHLNKRENHLPTECFLSIGGSHGGTRGETRTYNNLVNSRVSCQKPICFSAAFCYESTCFACIILG